MFNHKIKTTVMQKWINSRNVLYAVLAVSVILWVLYSFIIKFVIIDQTSLGHVDQKLGPKMTYHYLEGVHKNITQLQEIIDILQNTVKMEMRNIKTKEYLEQAKESLEQIQHDMKSMLHRDATEEMYILQGEDNSEKAKILEASTRTQQSAADTVCPEVYVKGKGKASYFALDSRCSRESKYQVGRQVTIAINLVSYMNEPMLDISKVVQRIKNLFPNMALVIALPKGAELQNKDLFTRTFHFTESNPAGNIWNTLFESSITSHILVARDLLEFDSDAQLERLLREMENLGVSIAGGAIKTPINGHWTHGCHQMAHKNYSLIFKSGYHHSQHDCLYCNYMEGPFLAKTEFLQDNRFNEYLPENLMFYDFFLSISKKHFTSIVCPDSMFNVRNKSVIFPRKQLLPLAKKWQLNKLVTPSGQSFSFTCKESGLAKTKKGLLSLLWKSPRETGLSVPPCKLQMLSDHVKFIMGLCKEHHLICELNTGTVLGAVKMNGLLPWEIDADILLAPENFTAFGKLEPIFRRAGNTLEKVEKPPKHYVSHTSEWNIDIYFIDGLDSVQAKLQGRKPTMVLFNGEWMPVPRNVGQWARNLFGPEIYKHAEHSLTGYNSGYFTKCSKPGGNNCLDQYEADGNMQFGDPVP